MIVFKNKRPAGAKIRVMVSRWRFLQVGVGRGRFSLENQSIMWICFQITDLGFWFSSAVEQKLNNCEALAKFIVEMQNVAKLDIYFSFCGSNLNQSALVKHSSRQVKF